MDIEAKIWGWVGTGSKLHSFVNGQALCRSSYKQGAGQLMDFCEAKQYGAKQYGVSVCTTCETKFNATIERLENSLKPSTGEGDYLPPAEDLNAPVPAAGCCDHAPMYHGARGCDECACATPRNRTPQTEETVTEPVTTKRAMVKPEISNKVIEALRTLRLESLKWFDQDAQDALNVLDNAGVFRAIDEASGYDLDPAPAPVSKCTCTQLHRGSEAHSAGCPGDPAEWGDMAYTTATAADNIRLAVDLKW